jgi:hypothetical protein
MPIYVRLWDENSQPFGSILSHWRMPSGALARQRGELLV